MPCLVCFLNFPCNKKWPKNKSAQNALKILYDLFLNISEFLVQIILEGGAPGGHNPPGRARTPGRALVGCGPHVGPLTYLFSPHYHLPPEKIPIALSPVFLSSNPRISISLLEAPFLKLLRGIVAWYVTPPFVQLVFVFVAYTLKNYLLLVLL